MKKKIAVARKLKKCYFCISHRDTEISKVILVCYPHIHFYYQHFCAQISSTTMIGSAKNFVDFGGQPNARENCSEKMLPFFKNFNSWEFSQRSTILPRSKAKIPNVFRFLINYNNVSTKWHTNFFFHSCLKKCMSGRLFGRMHDIQSTIQQYIF